MEGTKVESVVEKLYMDMEKFGDVTFLVGPKGKEEEIKSVVFLLRSLSSVFCTMFNDDWRSQRSVIRVPDIDPEMFRQFLKFMLNDNLTVVHLRDLNSSPEKLIELLYIANKYDVNSVQSVCRMSIEEIISIKTVIFIYENLQIMNEPELEMKAFNYIIANISKLINDSPSFTELCVESLATILKCEELSVREVLIFRGALRWAESQCKKTMIEVNGENIKKVLGNLLFLIRFPVMTNREFYETVQPTGILTSEQVIDISRCIAMAGDLFFVNNSRFSAKGRNILDRVRGVMKQPDMEYCYMFTPAEQMTLHNVSMSSKCPNRYYTNQIEYECPSHRYELKLCISNGDHDILLMTTQNITGNVLFSLEKMITLEPNKNYFIYYDLKRNGSAAATTMDVNGSTISISVC